MVQGNYIGTDATGNAALGNNDGLQIYIDAASNTVGGTASGARNVIAGNDRHGIYFYGGAPNNIVLGNSIGIGASGDPLANGDAGIIISGSSGITIGGVGAGEGNIIAHNYGAGVLLVNSGNGSVGNAIRGNATYANDGLGIDLDEDGATTNDVGDADDGPNRLQNFPEVQDASYDANANEITVTYHVPSDPGASGSGATAYPLTIDFYRADADNEEGAAYLGSDTYSSTDYSDGPVKTTSFTPAAPVTQADGIVATATDADGNTSEFSAEPRQLPVELVAFEATVDGTAVRLTWRTASETNNAGFAVQRRVDGAASFAEVGFVEGRGTTSAAQAYRFEDANLPYEAGRVTYRLAQIDADGTTEYSPEVEVALGAPERFTLYGNYPNPAHGTTKIRYALPKTARVRLTLYDMLGRRVAVLVDREQAAGRKEMTVDTSTLPSGLYLYRLRADGEVETRRMTVVK